MAGALDVEVSAYMMMFLLGSFVLSNAGVIRGHLAWQGGLYSLCRLPSGMHIGVCNGLCSRPDSPSIDRKLYT
jgi:hypothetical protein